MIALTVASDYFNEFGRRNGETILADTYTGLYEALYAKDRSRQQPIDVYMERQMDLLYAVNQAQAQILADGGDKHLAHASSAELDAIVNDDRSFPVWSGEEWTNACPLVVNADVYDEPGLTPPTGNVVAVSAADDRAFLLSLARLGWIDVDETAN